MIVELEGCSTKRAEAALKEAQGRIKLALVMVRKDVDAASAEALLLRHGGLLRAALEEAATSL